MVGYQVQAVTEDRVSFFGPGNRNDNVNASELAEELEPVVILNRRFHAKSHEEHQEYLKLSAIVQQESTHFQWWKQGLCLLMLVSITMLNLLMKGMFLGIRSCSGWYWGIQVIFVFECVLVTWLAVRLNNADQVLKRKYKVNYLEKDVRFEGASLRKLLYIGALGGWVAGALGLGGGSIYNPALLSLGCNPRVAGSTGMYLVLFSAFNSVIVNYLYGSIDIPYGLWISLWSMIGTVIGLYLADLYVKKSGKQSIFVWILVVVFIISAIVAPIFGGLSIAASQNPLFQFTSPC